MITTSALLFHQQPLARSSVGMHPSSPLFMICTTTPSLASCSVLTLSARISARLHLGCTANASSHYHLQLSPATITYPENDYTLVATASLIGCCIYTLRSYNGLLTAAWTGCSLTSSPLAYRVVRLGLPRYEHAVIDKS